MNIVETAEKLSFLHDIPTQFRVAAMLDGAEAPEAAIIYLKSAWERKERALIAKLRQERSRARTTTSEPTRSTAGTQPRRIPRSLTEFNKLTYSERLWVHDAAPEVYRRYTGRATKAEIMAIKDPDERQAAIACNLHLFLDREP